MYLKPDFEAALVAAVQARPAAAEAYRAGDPRLIAGIDAVATMFSMLSQQIDMAEVEPFIKSRQGTVMSDAALKGILPLAKPAKVQVLVENPGVASISIAVGRGILDGKGRRYTVDGAATVPPAGSAMVTAQQLTTRQITHSADAVVPFYEVAVTPPEDGSFLAGLDIEDAAGSFTYAPDFCNVASGDRVFHVETDEYRRMVARFGATGVVGHQPANGDILTLTTRECVGVIELEAGAGFSLEYVGNAAEAELKLTLDSILSAGSKPPDAAFLRMMARYPALHDGNAVFLSNFDFLLRRHMTGLEFLSVWNEQVEEAVRGANVANINRLFVSFLNPALSIPAGQAQATQIVARADNSYKVNFVAAVTIEVPVTVTARVSVVHDTADVEAQIRNVLLTEYGRGSVSASRGLNNVFRLQLLNQLLQDNVPALQDQVSDFSVVLGATPAALPEHFRFLSDASIVIAVTRVQSSTGLWNT